MDIKQLLGKTNIPKENILYDVEMKKYTSFKIGGIAECLIKIKTASELKEILSLIKEFDIKSTILGNGSNVLISDSGISGIVLKIEIEELEISEVRRCCFSNCWCRQ